MLEKIKLALRITSDAFDDEIMSLIEACKHDLKMSGIKITKKSDPLIERAIILYAKANFGYDDNNEKYQRSYDLLKLSMCLAGDYIDQK